MEKTLGKEIQQKKFDSFLGETDYSEDFPILWQFPKEFKRNWFKELDPRFLIILLATFIFEICILLGLLSWIKGKDQQIDVDSIQKRYAHLLLDKLPENELWKTDTKNTGTYLYGFPEEVRPTVSSSENQKSSGLSSSDRPGENYVPGAETITDHVSGSYSGQAGLDKTSNSHRGGSTDWIGSQGLLQYLSSDQRSGMDSELQEIFAQGDHNARYLEGSLANVNLTKFKQQGVSTESEAEGTINFGRLKGSKSTVSINDVRSSLTPLEKAQYSTVAKNTELEDFSASTMNKAGSKGVARNAEHVTKVVLAHNRAIQDCYKQALKKFPDVKGKVVVRFSVTPKGWVDQVKVLQSTIEYEPMLNCIINRIHRWNDFGESDLSLGTVSYRQTYVFGY